MMIDFYILKENSGMQSLQFACQLIEKAYQEQQKIYVHTASLAEAQRLDNLLWTYKEDSFIPHNIYQANEASPPPVQIGFGEPPNTQNTILINLKPEFPSFYQQFSRVIEIVFNDPGMQQLARERYKQYKLQQCEINTIKN